MSTSYPNILVLGASGMLGSTLLRYFAAAEGIEVTGTARSQGALRMLPENVRERVITGIDVENVDQLTHLLLRVQPTVVINCVGLIKQIAEAKNPLYAIPINAVLPHRLARLCQLTGSRLIHLSTDCVFSGTKGNYKEGDLPDADDVYGRTKLLGEVDYPNAVTLRTSIIGHELTGNKSLLNWFLSQTNPVSGYKNAIFSGLPTLEIGRIIHKYVLADDSLTGLFHVSGNPISKYDLLKLISDVYGHNIEIVPDEKLIIDRSLDSSLFQTATGFKPRPWPELIISMRKFG